MEKRKILETKDRNNEDLKIYNKDINNVIKKFAKLQRNGKYCNS